MKFEVAGAATSRSASSTGWVLLLQHQQLQPLLKKRNVPDTGGDEVNVTEIMVAVGDKRSEEQSLITVEGDKAPMEAPAHSRVW